MNFHESCNPIHFQPRGPDPGAYRVVGVGAGLHLVNRLTFTLSRSRKQVELEIAKSFAPALNPLRHERGGMLADEKFAGYTQRTSRPRR